jgi:hypothetical protein
VNAGGQTTAHYGRPTSPVPELAGQPHDVTPTHPGASEG